MLIGYARVSTGEQTLDLQLDALRTAGCEKTYRETASGAAAERPVLADVVGYLRPGDTLVVWRLDRLGRSLQHLLETVGRLQERGIGFRSLTESIDTTSSGGKLIFHVFGALAEFERELIRARTGEGRERAKARGIRLGRKPKLTAHQIREALARREAGEPLTEIGRSYNVSHSTISRLRA